MNELYCGLHCRVGFLGQYIFSSAGEFDIGRYSTYPDPNHIRIRIRIRVRKTLMRTSYSTRQYLSNVPSYFDLTFNCQLNMFIIYIVM